MRSTLGDVVQFFRILYKMTPALEAIQLLSLIMPLSAKLLTLMGFVSYSYAVIAMEMYTSSLRMDGPSYCHRNANYTQSIAAGARSTGGGGGGGGKKGKGK